MNALNTESKDNTVEKESKIQTKLVECVQTLYISDNVDEAINRLLQIIGEFYNAERCYIFEFDNDMNIIHNTYEWCAQGVESELEMLKNVEMSVIERWLYYFETKGEFYINSLSSEVSIDSPEFQILDIQGIKSLMAAPLRSENKLVGFMGVDNPQENTDSLILMRLVSAFVVNDMQKRETLEQRILRAIGNTYVSMNMVNFREDSQTEIKRFDVVAKYVSRTHGVAEMMRSAMTALTDEETRASTLEFTDLTTAPERLRDVSVLSHDFHSKNHWCRCSFYVMNRDDDGSVIDAIFAVQYIDKEKKKELEYSRALKRALENQNEIYAEMLHMQGCGVIASRTDNDEIMTMNGAAQQLFGVTGEGAKLCDVLKPIISDNNAGIFAKLNELCETPGECSFEFAVENSSGGLVYVKATARTVTLACGDRIMIITLMDITDKKKLENRLIVLSEIDALTSISNRGSGERRAEKLINSGVKGMFCLLDVDKFKSINDSFGHTVGDKALIEIADCLRRSFTGSDVVMRLGGDEFAVYAVGVETERQGAEKIAQFIANVDMICIPEMGDRKVTVSMGAVICQGAGVKFDQLYPMADMLCTPARTPLGISSGSTAVSSDLRYYLRFLSIQTHSINGGRPGFPGLLFYVRNWYLARQYNALHIM